MRILKLVIESYQYMWEEKKAMFILNMLSMIISIAAILMAILR